MIVYTVWERVNDWPESGGGDYLQRIFRSKEEAEKYCEQMNKQAEEDYREDNIIHYYVEKWPVY